MTKHAMVSIIMPVRNEAKRIGATLQAVFSQDYPSEFLQVIVADGMSADDTRLVCRQLAQQHPNFSMIDNPGQIVPTGFNAALRAATGEVIIRVDGHTIIAPDYVRQCVQALQASGAQNAGGKMTATGGGTFGSAVALATSSPFGVGGALFHYSDQEEWVDTVYMGAWPRQVFDKIGPFDEELVRDQDDEFNYRLREHGGKILLSPEIKSVYHVRSTPGSLWRQYYQYGYWKVRVLQKHPRQMRSRQFAPPAFVVSLLISALLAIFFPLGRVMLGMVLGAYVLANLAASTLTAARKGWKYLPLLSVTYAILHLSYGLGFLAGLVKFANRWGDRQGKVPAFSHADPSISANP